MTTAPSPVPRAHSPCDRLGLVLAAFALLLAPIGVLADKAVVPLTVVAALAGGLALGRAGLPWRIVDRPLAAILALFLAWCLVASLWSFEPLEGLKLALRISILISLLLYLAGLAGQLEARQRHRIARSLACGLTVAVLLIVVELALGGPILDALQGPAETDYAADSRLNRGVSTVAILAWPLTVYAWQQRRQAAFLMLPLAALVLALLSESSASALALTLALPAAAFALLGRQAARAVLAAAVIAAVLAAPLVAEALHRSSSSLEEILPETGLYRLHIWGVVNERIAERPVLGWGFDSSPRLPPRDAEPFRPDGKVIPSHPHNGSLQIMVELGAIGSLLALAVLFLVARRIDGLDLIGRATAVGMTITILGIANSAYGIWQSHWLAVIGAAAACFVTLHGRQDGTSGQAGAGALGKNPATS